MACSIDLSCEQCVDRVHGCTFGVDWSGIRRCVRVLSDLGDRVLSVTLPGGRCQGTDDGPSDRAPLCDSTGFFSDVASSGLGTVLGVTSIVGAFVVYTNRALIRRKLLGQWTRVRRRWLWWWLRCRRWRPVEDIELGGVSGDVGSYGTMSSQATASTSAGSVSTVGPAPSGRGKSKRGSGRGGRGGQRGSYGLRASTRVATVIALERQAELVALRGKRKRNSTL